MKRLLIAALCLMLCLSVAPLLAQTNEPPPYLYYYSRMLGGLIIERADGTDSRHIAADVLPPKLADLSGPGWSPSGRYFAASKMTATQYGSEVVRPIVIDTAGASSFPWFEGIGRISLMQWSPTKDILFMLGGYNSYRSPHLGATFWLIDVENNKILADFGANFSDVSTSLSDITWDLSNQRIQFYLSPETFVGRDYFRVTMQFDGTTLRERVAEEEFSSLAEGSYNLDHFPFYRGDATSPSGKYMVRGTSPTLMTDLLTRKVIELPQHSQATACRNYLWTKNEAFLITLTGTVVAGGGCGVGMIGVTDHKGQLWRELGWCSWSDPEWTAPGCVGWLPDEVDLNSLPSGSPEPMQLDPVRFEPEEEGVFGIGVLGLPFSRLLCNEQDNAYIMGNAQPRYRLITDICSVNKDAVLLREGGVQVVTAYDPVHDLLATYSEDASLHAGFVTLWIRSSGRYEPVFQLNSYGFALEFTDQGQYLRARNFTAWKVYAVDDILERIGQSNEPE
jgi:hypothetical protein